MVPYFGGARQNRGGGSTGFD